MATAHARPVAGSAQILFADDFSEQRLNPGSNEHCDWYYSGGEYLIRSKAGNLCAGYYPQQKYGDAAIEVDIRSMSVGFWEGGLAFRQSDLGKQYTFGIDSLGRYFLRNGIGNDRAETFIIVPTYSPYIHTGLATNCLKVVAQGDQITLYANGYFLASVTDASHTTGSLGFVVATVPEGADVEMAFDNLLIWSPP